MELSFGGACFLFVYYFGIWDFIRQNVQRKRIERVAGGSAGALFAVFYTLDLSLESCLNLLMNLMGELRSGFLGPLTAERKLEPMVLSALDTILPENAHQRLGNKVLISMTRVEGRSKFVVTEFASRQELIEALNCSCFVPLLSGTRAPTYKGVKCVDAFLSDNQPIFDERTITVSFIAGPANICPRDDEHQAKRRTHIFLNTPAHLTLTNTGRLFRAFWPLPAASVFGYIERGFNDARRFFLDADLIQCDSCYEKRSAATGIDPDEAAKSGKNPTTFERSCEECSRLRQKASESRVDKKIQQLVERFVEDPTSWKRV